MFRSFLWFLFLNFVVLLNRFCKSFVRERNCSVFVDIECFLFQSIYSFIFQDWYLQLQSIFLFFYVWSCDRAKQMNELVGFSLTTALFIVIGVFVIIRFWIRSCFYFFFFRPLQSHWCFRLEQNSRRIQQNKTKQNTGSRVSTKK